MAKTRFKNVQSVRGRDGTLRRYHRTTRARLPDDIDSPDFAEAWAREERATRPGREVGAIAGTYGDLAGQFWQSDEFAALAARTQADYAKVRDYMLANGAENFVARDLMQEHVETILSVALDQTNRRFAEYVLQFNRRLFNWSQERAARKRRWGDGNPWRDVKLPKQKRRAKQVNRPWEASELAEVLQRAPLGLRRAYVLGASGFDGGTMMTLDWDSYRDGRIGDTARGKTGVTAATIVPAPLRPFLEQGERRPGPIVTNAHGEPFANVNAMQTRSSEFLRGLAADGVVGEGLTMHGLRHTLGRAMAETGAPIKAIQGALRHATERMAMKYSAGADQVRAGEDAVDHVGAWFNQEEKQ